MEYVQKTVAAYDSNPLRYIENTKETSPLVEINKFTESLPLGGLVLDAGCAFGRDTKTFSDKGFKAVGIDLSHELLKHAKEFSPQSRFLRMDVRSLDFPNNYFDGIWCNATLLHLNNEDLRKALEEFNRVIKKSGILFVSFKEGMGSEELLDPLNNDYSKFYNYQTADSIKNLLGEVGFKSTEIDVVNGKDKFAKDKRDINWIFAFARK